LEVYVREAESVAQMKWEYVIVTIYTGNQKDSSAGELTRLGEEGWEAVSAWSDGGLGSYVLMKRKK
jgi:hypothetical protein